MEKKNNKFILNFKKYFISYLISFIIGIFVGAIIFVLMFFAGPNVMTFVGALDGLSVATLSLLGVGGLMFVAHEGMFDSLTYGFNQLTTSMFNKKANRYNDYPTYLENKRTSRKSSANYFASILFSSIPYLIATIIMFILSKTLF